MDATEQVAPTTEVPGHLVAATEPEVAAAPGVCPRCGESHSAPLMRSDRVEYRLCEECGRVWVERCVCPASVRRAAPIRYSIVTRALAALTAAVRFMTFQQM